MKYIKRFEEVDFYKKFFLLRKDILMGEKVYYVLEPIEIEYDNDNNIKNIRCKKRYTYKYNLVKNKHQYYNIDISDKDNIIFESDDLKRTIDMIQVLKNTPKYNL